MYHLQGHPYSLPGASVNVEANDIDAAIVRARRLLNDNDRLTAVEIRNGKTLLATIGRQWSSRTPGRQPN
ncbi:MAG: hypothetical protein R3C52_06705 [Hyphomonadaceae bacterium]